MKRRNHLKIECLFTALTAAFLWLAFGVGCYDIFSGVSKPWDYPVAMVNMGLAVLNTMYLLNHIDNFSGFHVTEHEKWTYSEE